MKWGEATSSTPRRATFDGPPPRPLKPSRDGFLLWGGRSVSMALDTGRRGIRHLLVILVVRRHPGFPGGGISFAPRVGIGTPRSVCPDGQRGLGRPAMDHRRPVRRRDSRRPAGYRGAGQLGAAHRGTLPASSFSGGAIVWA